MESWNAFCHEEFVTVSINTNFKFTKLKLRKVIFLLQVIPKETIDELLLGCQSGSFEKLETLAKVEFS